MKGVCAAMLNRLLRTFFPGLVNVIRVKSIQFIITISITLIIVVMVLAFAVIYNKFSTTAEDNADLSTQQILEQIKFNLEYYLKGMTDVFELVDDRVRESGGVFDEKLMEKLSMITGTREDIVSVALFTSAGEPVMRSPQLGMRNNTGLTEQSWFKSAQESPNHLSFSLPHIQNLFLGTYKWVVSMSKGVTFERDGKLISGVLLVDVNFKTIDDMFQRVSLGKRGYVYIIDESAGNIIYHPQQQLIYIGLKYENVEQALKFTYGRYFDTMDGEKRIITVKTVNNIGWKLVGVSYLDEIVSNKSEIGTFFTWLLVVFSVFVLLISAYMTVKISSPIKRLERSMKRVERGDFATHLDVRGSDEVERLARRFNVMVSKIGQLMEQVIHEQETKRKNELEVLQAQINPHFLYNTLNSVVRMVGSGKNEDVITTITSLSKLFRISLSSGKPIITVQEELEHIKHYLIIQKMRYKNKFDYEIVAQDETLSCRTLKLILQPLVENAIYHGIESMPDQGFIRITAATEGDRILFQVEDNGLGIEPQKLKTMLYGPTHGGGGSGVGVRNVHERIRLYFGDAYGLQFESKPEEGTIVKVWIPRLQGEERGSK